MIEEQEQEAIEFKKYLSNYEKTLDLIIEFHNRHINFKKFKGKDSARQLRNSIRELIKIQRELSSSAWLSFQENLEISKIRKKLSKENKLKYKLNKAKLKKEQLENNK